MEGGDIIFNYTTTLSDLAVIWTNIVSGEPTNNLPMIRNAQIEEELAGEYRYKGQFFLRSVGTTRFSEAIVIGKNLQVCLKLKIKSKFHLFIFKMEYK